VRKTLAGRATVRGEFVLLFAPAAAEVAHEGRPKSLAAEVRELMKAQGLSEKDALKQVARARNIGKSEAYRELQRERGK
jgi:16S rRNA (cytidine1402-2'-O)-methyltransferase